MRSLPRHAVIFLWILSVSFVAVEGLTKTEGLAPWIAANNVVTSDAPSDTPSDVPSSAPSLFEVSSASPTRGDNIVPLSSAVPTVTIFQDQGVMQTCSGTAQLEDGVPYAVSPIGPNESETFCFEPGLSADRTVYCYTLCMDDRVCNSDFNQYISSDAMLGLSTYGQGAYSDALCGSQNYYTNDEYCSVMLETSKQLSGVQVTVSNTLTNNKAVDWAGAMDSVFVSCSTELPPCRGAFLTADNSTEVGKKKYTSETFLLPAYKVDPNEPLSLPPMFADFCLDEFQVGSKIACKAECASSTCSGKATIFLERNYPSRDFICRGINEPCAVTVEDTLERLLVRVRSMKDSGPLIDYGVTCTVTPPTSIQNKSNATSSNSTNNKQSL
jgi:hypothetical protein